MNQYKFDCGCEVEIVDNQIKEMDGLPGLHIDYENLRLDCPKVWEFIGTGQTKGIFQLETNLGQAWARRILPESVSEMAALGALLRPGVLRAIVDGKSMTQHYADRKSGKEEVEAFHEALEPILRETYQILVFQEQILSIAKDIAGFTLQQGEVLRKSVGKKLPELMTKVKGEFLEGCKQTGKVNEKEASEIFEWIEKSNRYSFNLCLSLNTIVQTEFGLTTLEEVDIGEWVLSPDNEYVQVIDKYYNGEKDLCEITLESGKTIQCTLDHKFLCEDGEIKPLIEILEKNEKIMCQDD